MLNPITIWLWGEVIERQGFLLTREKTANAAQPFCGAALHPALRTHNPGWGSRLPPAPGPDSGSEGPTKGSSPSAQIPLPLPLSSRPEASWRTAQRCLALLQLPRVRVRARVRKQAAPSLQAGTQLPPLRSPLNPPATSSPPPPPLVRCLSRSSLLSFVPSLISLFVFFFQSLPPPPVPALLPHPLSDPPRQSSSRLPAAARSPLLQPPPSCPISRLIPPPDSYIQPVVCSRPPG